jgi:hypothetical protein
MVRRRGRRFEARVGPIVIVFVFCYQGVVWVEGEEVSSAGHGQETGKWVMLDAMAAKRPYAI